MHQKESYFFKLTYLFTLSLFIIFSSPLHADDHLDDEELEELEPGFNGSISLISGRSESQGLNEINSDNRLINNLTQANNETDLNFIFPLWQLNYNLQDRRTSFYFGVPDNDIIDGEYLFELGVSHLLDSGQTLRLAYLPEIPEAGEVWQDPFLTQEQRKEAEANSQAVTLSIEELLGGLASLRLGYGTFEIKNDDIGNSLQGNQLTDSEVLQLKRDSYIKHIDTSVFIPLSRSVFAQLSLGYNETHSIGKANNHDTTLSGLSLIWKQPKVLFTANVTQNKKEYDNNHPVFNTIRDDTSISYTLLANFSNAFGWEKTSMTILAEYGKNDSNIHFYDNKLITLGGGLTYSF